jgi:hypothetical protein
MKYDEIKAGMTFLYIGGDADSYKANASKPILFKVESKGRAINGQWLNYKFIPAGKEANPKGSLSLEDLNKFFKLYLPNLESEAVDIAML